MADLRRPGPVLVLADPVRMRRDGVDLKAHVVSLLAGADARTSGDALGVPAKAAPTCTVEEARNALAGAGCVVVSVGSGDPGPRWHLGKKATEGAGDVPPIPYVVVQTACSVNAFSDDMAVLLLHGAKRTLPSRWPDALVIDLGVIADAPPDLNQAGVGELTSMFTGPCDWRLADLAGLDPGYDDAVVGLFRDGGEELERVAAGVAAGDHGALAWLCERMTLSGLALGVAGRTAPISGAEHAVSHLLDMAAIRTGRATGYHGAQVGVASVVVAALWEDLLEGIEPGRLLDPPSDPEDARASGSALWRVRPVRRDGRECWRLYQRRKRCAWAAGRAAQGGAGGRLGRACLTRLTEGLRPPTRSWPRCGPPAPRHVRRPGRGCGHRPLGRGRRPPPARPSGFLDLADLAGRWGPADVDRVLERAAAVGGGL
ncbi:MAG: iron-containing alcohol dehydrogenase [Chloroflexota bacterium]